MTLACLPLPSAARKRRFVQRRLRQQEGRCILCEQPLEHDMSVEHIWPRSHGGPNKNMNKALSHTGCNARKGDALPTAEVLLRFKAWCNVDLPRVWLERVRKPL